MTNERIKEIIKSLVDKIEDNNKLLKILIIIKSM